MKIVLIAFILTYRSQHCTSETIFCGVMFYSALLRPLCHLTISSQVDQLPCEVTACLHSSECGVIRWGFVSDHGWRWETFSMLRECEGPSGWLSSHSYSPSPAGWLTGDRNSKQVEEALPEGPLPCYNPSKWNQSGTMHPTVASKSSPRLSLSWVRRCVPLWRPHLKSAVSHWRDKVAMASNKSRPWTVCFCFCLFASVEDKDV